MRARALCSSSGSVVLGLTMICVCRVSGRPSHVAKLRSEFDTGADYSLVECDPGDLDPHAVASIFKAYLRECKLRFFPFSTWLLNVK